MFPNWCNALLSSASLLYLVQRCMAWACLTPTWSALARLSAIMLVVDKVKHPIRRHYTPSDRVYRDGSGVSRRIGCSAHGRAQLDAGMCSVSEDTHVQACCR